MSGMPPLTPDAALPDVVRAPAPWTLRGDGWIMLLRLPEAARSDPRQLPPELRGRPLAGPSMLMFVDYAESPAARGRASLARVGSIAADPELLGEFSGARVSLALRIPEFRLHFPVAASRRR